MHSLRFTLCLLLVLFVPLLLRLKPLELYPAILLPNGSSAAIYSVNHKMSFEYREAYALDKNKKWKKIDLDYFIDPVPIQYYDNVFAANFGRDYNPIALKKEKYIALPVYHFIYGTYPDLNYSPQDVMWIKTRLQRGNFDPSTIKIVTSALYVSSQTGNLIEKKILNEKNICFDK